MHKLCDAEWQLSKSLNQTYVETKQGHIKPNYLKVKETVIGVC